MSLSLQVLVSTMNQIDHTLLDKMNIQSDAIVINQSDSNKFEEFVYKKNRIRFITLAERGVGLSRNTAFMRASADISLFADDDVSYIDGYKKVILDEFVRHPKADVIVFNVLSTNIIRQEYIVKKFILLRFYNCLRYGAFRIVVRTNSVRRVNIYFSLLFGGGAKYSSGEDSLFIADCIKKGYVYALHLK